MYMTTGPEQAGNTCMFDKHSQMRCVVTCDDSDYCNENMTWAPRGW